MSDETVTPGDGTGTGERRPGDEGSGRDKSRESSPTKSGHSTADDEARRNQENESPS